MKITHLVTKNTISEIRIRKSFIVYTDEESVLVTEASTAQTE